MRPRPPAANIRPDHVKGRVFDGSLRPNTIKMLDVSRDIDETGQSIIFVNHLSTIFWARVSGVKDWLKKRARNFAELGQE